MSAHIFVIQRVQGRWVDAFADVRVVAGITEAVRQLPADGVAWVDLAHPEWIAQLRAARPELPIVALSLNPSAAEAMTAFDAGVRGYCHALAVPEMLQQVAMVVSNGGLWLGVELMAQAAATIARLTAPVATEAGQASPLKLLTPREREVALQVVAGASNKEVARQLDITPRTVKAHMGAIFDKLGARDRLQLVLLLRRAGVSPDAER